MTSSPLAADEALWQRALIVSMAEAAIEGVGADMTFAFFAAADRPGMQRSYLTEACRRITGLVEGDPVDD